MRVLILDGYTDEPAGLGVPPYIDVYPRYIAGAVWSVDKGATVRYVTADEARRDVARFIKEAQGYDILIVIAGVTVPGRYLSGRPLELAELKEWFRLVTRPTKILVGPAARFGIGREGGTVAALPREVEENFDYVVRGDPEEFIYEGLRHGFEKASPYRLRESYDRVAEFTVRGARIVEQHPNHGYNLVAEIETFRGCPRVLAGGCSFCTEVLHGLPRQRRVEDVVREVEALYRHGVRNFRIGRQPDILVYQAEKLREEEFPRPNPEALRRLFHGIRSVAPHLETLHIDNVNPGTIARHREESVEALKTIIEYHTPGDVAAMGLETADPRVVEANNLNVYPEEALEAIRIVNRLGGRRGYNGLPELLPGINFVLGLAGETRETYRLNYEFLKKLVDEGLVVRRINIRQVLVFPHTRISLLASTRIIRKHRELARAFTRRVRSEIDPVMLRRVAPRGTVLRGLYVEKTSGGWTYARQPASYPLLAEIPCRIGRGRIDVVVYDQGARSVKALPVPLDVSRTPMSVLRKLLGSRAVEVLEAARREGRVPPDHSEILAVGSGHGCETT